MNVAKALKILVGALGAVIVALLIIFIFINPVQAPQHPGPSAATSTVSPDGHVVVLLPKPGDLIASPVAIEGTVTGGGWFFEASFPVKVLDANGTVVGQGIAQAGGAPGSWMSTDTIPFSALVTFSAPSTATGTVVLMKDNPSGLSANAMEFSVPVGFGGQSVSGASSTGENGSSGINGQVVLGPTCPVEHVPPDPACAPRPYQTSIRITQEATPTVAYKTISTDASGTFSVVLPPGAYTLTPQGGNPFPRCADSSAIVTAGAFQMLTLTCDTGIR
jgi:Immunoglobulin-like domain of bacterial spore germination